MELHARQAAFLERRRWVLRVDGLLYGGALLGIGVLILARHVDPAIFEALLPFCVSAGLLGGAGVWLAHRQHWRCPECEARWPMTDTLASLHWQHCPDCGVGLVLDAAFQPAAEEPDPELSRLQRIRWRWAGAAILLILLLTLGATRSAQAHGWNELSLDVLAATGAGLAVAAAAVASRCPSCKRGMVAGRSGRCSHCGTLIK